MSFANKKSGIEIPDRMRIKLKKFQRKVWIIKLAEGLLAAAFGLLVSYLLVFVLDRFFDTPVVIRTAILIAGALGLGVWFPLVCHKWIWKSRRLEQVARLLKYKFPRLGDHLLGIIQLVNNEQESHRSEALTRAALAQVDEETKNREFGDAVPYPKHRRWALIAGIPAVIAAAALVLVPSAGNNALMRWLMPWKHTPRYTFAQIESLPESVVVPIAEKSSLSATLSSDTQWSPKSGSAFVSGTDLSALQENGQYGFELPPLKEGSRLNVSIGDIRETVEITPMARPEISQLLASITLPDYLQRSEPIVKDVRGGVVTMVTGSEVEFVGTATRDIVQATANGQALQVDGSKIKTSPISVNESQIMELQWKDALDLTSKQPLNLKLRAERDQEPSLVCLKLEKQRVVMEKQVLTFEVEASDDFGIKTLGMQWAGTVGEDANYESAAGQKIVAAGTPESSELTTVATFSPERLGIQPQVIKLRLYAQDYLPDREPVFSPTYTVFVLSEADHAIWLTRRMDEWFKQSLETYEREQQLYKQNIELSELTADELDRPKNRNKVAAQAALEQAQQRRLEALTKAGTTLVQQAAGNDQFDAATLEKLSGMLESFDDITENRMTIVSKALQEAADAASSDTDADDSNGLSNNLLEPSMDTPEPSQAQQGGGNSGEGTAALGLPTVQLQGSAAPSGNQPATASNKLQAAVGAQENLLVEFQKVAEELKKIIQNLEGSTFVKRLKAMSRMQMELAQDVNEMTVREFGVSDYQVEKPTKDRSQLLADRQLLHRTTTTNIQDDLQAYVDRIDYPKYQSLLEEMESSNVIEQLADVSVRIIANESGSSIAQLELLADTFDRWAEQLVDPLESDGASTGGDGSSLPPAIILEVMKILEKEIALRDETRGLEQAKPQMDSGKYSKDAASLANTQKSLTDRIKAVGGEIRNLENAADFEDILTQINGSRKAMNDVFETLNKPDTGPTAIGAETEAIEWLLEARRSGGPPHREGEDMTGSALALLGAADEKKAQGEQRVVEQATGKSEKEVAEEFRYGLDQYFESLEKNQ